MRVTRWWAGLAAGNRKVDIPRTSPYLLGIPRIDIVVVLASYDAVDFLSRSNMLKQQASL